MLIKSSGSKIWRFNYYRPVTKIRSLISFSNYSEISLQQARKKRDEARELIRQGLDPQEHSKSKKSKQLEENNNTFIKVAEKWFTIESSKGLTEDTLKRIWALLENHIFPSIGHIPITQRI